MACSKRSSKDDRLVFLVFILVLFQLQTDDKSGRVFPIFTKCIQFNPDNCL